VPSGGGIIPPNGPLNPRSNPVFRAVRLCSSAHSSFGVVVTIAKLRTHSPSGDRQFSHRPARAIRHRSASATA
jgi:hypothetical protein